jgi:heme-degrading monooxygenase HmoA
MDEARYASGRWQVQEGKADEFVSRWNGWMVWTSENIPGFRSATLLRSDEDALLFVSVSDWDDKTSLKSWKASPGFREKIAAVRDLCDEMQGGDYVVATQVAAAPART